VSDPSRPAVHLRVPGFRRHVFFFRKMVKRPETPIEPGSIVDVFDRSGAPLGCGFYNPHSEIAIRMLGPTEPGLIERRVREAIAFRESLAIDADAYRVCHSEGDGLSGLVVDQYGPVHSIELFSLGMYRQVPLLRGLFPNAWVRADERVQGLEGFRMAPDKPPDAVVVQEHGVKFRVDFATGHKTGFFCDQRENRREVARLAKGRTLLDLCCYTGGFGVAAAAGGASRVLGIDMDEEALVTAGENARLNGVKVESRHVNVFDHLRGSAETWDVVVLDPPKMARDRGDLAKGLRGYFDMNRLAVRAVKPGGVFVTCSCTGLVGEEEFLGIVREACERELRIFRVTGAGPDHPVSSWYPEGRYLKVVYARVV